MARQTRQQRRDRRAQQQPALAGGAPPRGPARPTSNGGGDSEPSRRQPRSDERHVPGSGPIHFVGEAWAELKQVEWPSQRAVVSGTAVVLSACLIVGVYLALHDTDLKYVVQPVLRR